MADEKTTPGVQEAPPATPPTTYPAGEPIPRPAGWRYKGFKIGKKEYWYAMPQVQILMVAFICFLCPGMFNALTGLGGGGQVDASAQDDASTALYSTFAVVGFFSGTFANRLGIRLTLAFGGLGYCIYSASFLSYSHTQNRGFVVFAGAFLGVCAGLLWCGQGAIMMSYPPEDKKGRYIARFWIIFNLGAVIGALIPLGENIHKVAGAVTDGTYIAFIVLMAAGAVIALFMCNANVIQRDDGSHVILMKNPTWQSELWGLWETLLKDPWILLLFPMFFTSNIPYTWQMNDMNGAHFNVRTRSLNNVLYWASQIFGAIVFGHALDYPKLRRSVRARAALVALAVLTFVIWGGGWAWEKDQAPRSVVEAVDADGKPTWTGQVDWTDGGKKFIGPMFLYIFMGFYDAAWQTCIYWYMGSLSNSSRKAANMAGFYKGIQSAGNAIFWRLDGLKKPYHTIFGATWGCLAGALLFAAPIIILRVKDSVSLEEDLKFTDENLEDVAPAGVIAHDKTVDA